MAKRNIGVGTLLIAVYGIFAISATARASYQLIREFDQAPLAYSLSAMAALVYVVATFSLAKTGRTWFRVAKITVAFELFGVLLVGMLSLTTPALFAHPSVWSNFGAGYGYVPLLLPILGLFWLRKQDAAHSQA